jgi:recombination protein RecA
MAKKKEVAPASPDEFTDRIYREVEKEYGDGVLIGGQSVVEAKRMVIPISPALDIITSGGILEGSFVGITGNPKTGKTTLAEAFAATCQQERYGSRPVYYAKVEGRLAIAHLKGIAGLDLKRFHVIQSIKGRILTAQDHLRIYESILRNEPGAILIIDSISALCDEREMLGGVGTETRGSGAKLFSQWLNTMSNVVPVNGCIVLGITHLMCNTSGMGAQYIEKATRRWHYQCDYQLRTVKKEEWKAANRIIGLKITWKCNTSPLGPPGSSIESYLRFGTGIDRLFEVLNFGVATGLIKQAGAWYSLEFLNSAKAEHLRQTPAPKAQGGEGVYSLLKENPEWAQLLEHEVLSMAGGLAGSEE